MRKHYEARTNAHVDTLPHDAQAGRMRKDEGMSEPQERRVVVVGPDGQPIGRLADATSPEAEQAESDTNELAGMVEQPAKVMRIGTMIKQLLEEVRAAPLDEASRQRLTEIHRRSIDELEDGLAPELQKELERLSLPFEEGSTPAEPRLRIALARPAGA